MKRNSESATGEKLWNDVPIICAECTDTGKITKLNDGNHLTCALMGNRPIWGSKPKWCPKGPFWKEEE